MGKLVQLKSHSHWQKTKNSSELQNQFEVSNAAECKFYIKWPTSNCAHIKSCKSRP